MTSTTVLRAIAVVDEYLAWLTHNERSPNTAQAYAFDLEKAREIDRALAVLEEAGRLRRATSTNGHGRPAETWLPFVAAA